MLAIGSRKSVIRALVTEDVSEESLELLPNAELQNRYFDLRKRNKLIGSLCPITKARNVYNLMLSHAGIPNDMAECIGYLPDELVPEFTLINNNGQQQAALVDKVGYIFIKKIPGGKYTGLKPEKIVRLLERSKILRSHSADEGDIEFTVVFPPGTKAISEDMLKTFKNQAIRKLNIVRDGEVIHSEESKDYDDAR